VQFAIVIVIYVTQLPIPNIPCCLLCYMLMLINVLLYIYIYIYIYDRSEILQVTCVWTLWVEMKRTNSTSAYSSAKVDKVPWRYACSIQFASQDIRPWLKKLL